MVNLVERQARSAAAAAKPKAKKLVRVVLQPTRRDLPLLSQGVPSSSC
jgi:hypothetical protein